MIPGWKCAWLLVLLSKLDVAGERAPWKQLFNGQDLSRWEHVGPGRCLVERGLLKTEGGMGLLWYTPEKIGDAVLRVVYKTTKRTDNSGVFIRIPEPPTDPWMPVHRGYEIQIDDSEDDYHVTGVLYSLTRALARPGKTGGWNTLEITLDGPRTVVMLNGVKVTEYTEGQPVPPQQKLSEPERGPRPREGYIGLQNHGEEDVAYFKEIAVRSLEL